MIRKLTTVGYEAANAVGRFICDYQSDLSDLPTQTRSAKYPEMDMVNAGSTAVVLEDGTQYMLDNQGQWKQLSSGGGGGDIDIATDAEVMEYIFG